LRQVQSGFTYLKPSRSGSTIFGRICRSHRYFGFCCISAADAAAGLKNNELKKLQETVNYAQRHDSVTKALNGAAFAAAVEHYIDRRKRIATDAGGVMIAVVIDTLDAISRRYGPQWADTVMQSLATITQSSVRSGDLVARLASNELGVFLPGATIENAQDVGMRIRRRCEQAAFATAGDAPLSLDIKLGGAVFDGPTDFNHIRQLADEMASR
jgi:diguanylate cyclase (GGDEF)-like protein